MTAKGAAKRALYDSVTVCRAFCENCTALLFLLRCTGSAAASWAGSRESGLSPKPLRGWATGHTRDCPTHPSKMRFLRCDSKRRGEKGTLRKCDRLPRLLRKPLTQMMSFTVFASPSSGFALRLIAKTVKLEPFLILFLREKKNS